MRKKKKEHSYGSTGLRETQEKKEGGVPGNAFTKEKKALRTEK